MLVKIRNDQVRYDTIEEEKIIYVELNINDVEYRGILTQTEYIYDTYNIFWSDIGESDIFDISVHLDFRGKMTLIYSVPEKNDTISVPLCTSSEFLKLLDNDVTNLGSWNMDISSDYMSYIA